MANEKQRAPISFGVDLGNDLSTLSKESSNESTPRVEKEAIKKVAEKQGFTSRQVSVSTQTPTPSRTRTRRRGRSPFTSPKTLRIREGLNDLIIDVGERLGMKDCELFDKCFHEFVEKHGTKDEKNALKRMLESN